MTATAESRRLYLLRHGHADWPPGHAGDEERPLATRGRDEAGLVGRYLSRLGEAPELIVSSTAVRARSTAEVAAQAGAWTAALRLNRALYDSSVPGLLDVVRQTPDDVFRLLLVGHLPNWPRLAGSLIGGGDISMPTGTLVCLEVGAAPWSRLEPRRATLRWCVTPELLARFDVPGSARSDAP